MERFSSFENKLYNLIMKKTVRVLEEYRSEITNILLNSKNFPQGILFDNLLADYDFSCNSYLVQCWNYFDQLFTSKLANLWILFVFC